MIAARRRSRRMLNALRTDWREFGLLGRLGLIGLLASAAVAVLLGFSITRAAETHLLDARADLVAGVVAAIAADYPAVPTTGDREFEAFDEEVRLSLLGSETVRVKAWDSSGRIVYSDVPEQVGREFELSSPARDAFAGSASSQVSDLSDPAHAEHRHFDALIELYLPYPPGSPDPSHVLEVEQTVDDLNAAMRGIKRNVWLSIGSGIGILAVFLGALLVAGTRSVIRGRRRAESLLASLLDAQDEERRRIVGSLHDDVGQPLYRLLYGLESLKPRLEGATAREEVDALADVVRRVDGTLRSELRLLHGAGSADAGLGPALRELAESTRRESGLDIVVDIEVDVEPGEVARAVLFRAAREALTNVRKHASAGHVTISMTKPGGEARLVVTDDGTGRRIEPGLGLTTIRERLEAVGGGLDVVARRGHGTSFTAWVPLSEVTIP